MLKKILPIGIAVILAGVVAGVNISSASKGNCNFEVSPDGTYYIVKGKAGILTSKVTIPDEYNGKPVKEIAEEAFNTGWLFVAKEVVISKSITKIGEYAFTGYGADALKIVRYEGDVADWCKITFGNNYGNPFFEENPLVFINGQIIRELIIPEEVTELNDYAFASFDSITSVEVPYSVTKTGKYVFWSCDTLKTAKVNATTIGVGMFQGCNALETVIIEDNVRTIANTAFWGANNLKSVVMSKGVTSVGDGAFLECDSLKAVYYEGTANDWKQISISTYKNYNSRLTNAKRYYYSEAQPTSSGNYWHYGWNGEVVVW